MSETRAPTYDLIKGYTDESNPDSISVSPYWALLVVRLGVPLSFSRERMASVTTDASQGAKLRGDSLLIISDCIQLVVDNNKENHLKTLSSVLIQSDINYLVEILPGDWVFAWICNNKTDFENTVKKIKDLNPNNPPILFDDGFKFMGRVSSIRKSMRLDRGSGIKTVNYQLQAIGFKELDSTFYYDYNLAEADVSNNNIGNWLAKVGLDVQKFFGATLEGGQKDNINEIIPTLIDLIIGRGVSKNVNPTGAQELQASPTTQASDEAPYAYLVPKTVGTLLGYQQSDTSKKSGILSYADILNVFSGTWSFNNTSREVNNNLEVGLSTQGKLFAPDIDSSQSTSIRRKTPTPMLGAFIPVFPEFTSKPLWSVLQQFLNPTVNELYTCLRTNEFGRVVPTVILRQIPFTTEAFTGGTDLESNNKDIKTTKFLDLPRWKLHPVLVNDVDIGRSDATRVNFIHCYGIASYNIANMSETAQIVSNAPIRDDLDIYRSGIRPYQTQVACAVQNQAGKVPGVWMKLIADWMMGGQYTLNGTLQCVGIHLPLAEGDNLEWDGMVFHIEKVTHMCSMDIGSGNKSFVTNISVSNGLNANGKVDQQTPQFSVIYPGFDQNDTTTYDPGLSLDDSFDREEPKTSNSDLNGNNNPIDSIDDSSNNT